MHNAIDRFITQTGTNIVFAGAGYFSSPKLEVNYENRKQELIENNNNNATYDIENKCLDSEWENKCMKRYDYLL